MDKFSSAPVVTGRSRPDFEAHPGIARPAPGSRAPSWFVVLVALSAAFSGGDTSVWGQVLPIVGIALLLFLAPLRALPKRTILLGALGLLICAGAGFLPATFLGETGVQTALRHLIPGLPPTLTLQWEQGLISTGILVAALLFGFWMIQWSPKERTLGLQQLGVGITMVGALSLLLWTGRLQGIPWWHPNQGFGPFANRNQTANLLALGAILMLGSAARSFRGRRWTAWFWLGAFFICLGAVITANSRAALALLVLGIGCWFVARIRLSNKVMAIGAALILIIAALALVGGEQLVRRFPELGVNGLGFRSKIFGDAAVMIAHAPVAGAGIGNFEGIFPSYREASLNFQRIIHPESDWLWMASELGVGAVIFCGLAIIGVFRSPINASTRGEKDLLVAGAIGVVAFVVHSLVDVPAHRFGTVLPALMVAGICFRAAPVNNGPALLRACSRIFGCALIFLAIFLWRDNRWSLAPRKAVAAGDWPLVETTISKAIRVRPLDWSLYNLRAHLELGLGNLSAATQDFAIVRQLEPKLAMVSWDEGKALLEISPSLAFEAWKEALKRGPAEGRESLYGQMMGTATSQPLVQEALLRLSDSDLGLALMAVRTGIADSVTFDFLTKNADQLDLDQRRFVLLAMARKAALAGDCREGYLLARNAMKPVPYPARKDGLEDGYRAALLRNPADIEAIYNLALQLNETERTQEALTIMRPVTARADCPPYLLAFQAELQASLADWVGAWGSVARVAR